MGSGKNALSALLCLHCGCTSELVPEEQQRHPVSVDSLLVI